MARFSKLLVANRGEIAVRVLRAARALGYATVAVYSEADAGAPHVALADQAVCIGPAAARASYLDGERLLEAARRTGADAIHPGYGFLAENAAFAMACEWAGVTFVGPSPDAIQAMGDKAQAKARMEAAGVPCVPGYRGDQEPGALAAAARQVGFPLLVKAAAGGGGRGMRRVDAPEALEAAIAAAQAEASAAFGDGTLLLERLIEGARHVEVQVLADAHGAVIHLGERDCSTQRRYQKVIEEAPSPAVDPELRARMGEAAVAAARAIGYRGAGTVEMLLAPDGAFYFLEMNTRLQVEHPVTEAVTGLDLVELQLRVAAGEPLPLAQQEVRLGGHAIEARLYAEDPAAGHLPQTGRVVVWAAPGGEGVRCDHGLRPGLEVTPYYDPMLAKVIARGRDREEARRRLARALRDTAVLGLRTNKGLLLRALAHPAFVSGEVTTGFLDGPEGEGLAADPPPSAEELALAAVLLARGPARGAAGDGCEAGGELADGWRPTGRFAFPVPLTVDGGAALEVEVRATAPGAYEATPPGAAAVAVRVLGAPPEAPHALRVELAGVQETVHVAWTREPAGEVRLHLERAGALRVVAEDLPRGARDPADAAGDGQLRAPTSGSVTRVAVAVGERVRRGQPAVAIEAMKIESQLCCDVDGVVAEVRVAPGDQVQGRQVLVVIAPAEEEQA